jgi:hypothetical protein
MKGDFSRAYGAPKGNDNGVLYQQGRVFTDSDGNAQTAITTAWQDTAGRDVVGPNLAAVPAEEAASFKVEAADLAAGEVTLTVAPGRVWADGLLVRLDESPPISRVARYLQPPVQDPAFDSSTIAAGVRDAVVLEVWREALNGFQVPERLIEPALGGPDTTERLHSAFDFRLLRLEPGDSCDNIAHKLDDQVDQKGTLSVTLEPPEVIVGECPVAEGGGYTGFEHNLYRIEIAETDGSTALFKWSQFNGGLVGRGLFDAATERVTITANLQAIVTSGLDDFYLETREYDDALGRWRVTYGAGVTLNDANELVLPAVPNFGAVPAPGAAVFFRLWNGIREIADFPVAPDPTPLQDGIRLAFQADALGRYTAEDYWTFPVRAGEITNLETLVDAAPPDGIRHHRVPLAILNWDGSPDLTVAEGTIDDCREVFQPLTRLGHCCTYRVGDGIRSHGEFQLIQDAIDALPAAGGQVCILPGTYNENLVIDGRAEIMLSGCGKRSRIVSGPPAGEFALAGPVIHVRDSRNIRIEHLAVEAHDSGIGVLLENTGTRPAPGADEFAVGPPLLRHIGLRDLWVTAATRSAIEVRGGAEIEIRDCDIQMADRATHWPAVFFLGDDGRIERNVIRVRPRDQAFLSEGTPLAAGAGLGGIQLAGTCERVWITENLIQGGNGNGITLGSIMIIDENGEDTGGLIDTLVDDDDPCFPCRPGNTRIPDPRDDDDDGRTRRVSAGPLREITIADNRILDMGLNGIGVIGFFSLDAVDALITVERLTIVENQIRRCLGRSLAPIEAAMIDSMGYGGIALADVELLVIRENVIEDNGFDHLDPVCGIYLLHGEGVEIVNNRIFNNGAKTGEPAKGARPGARGGIHIVYCIAPTLPLSLGRRVYPRQDGTPALMAQDNVVSQPLGRALSAAALGPVMVHGNELTSRGVAPRSDSLLAATVAILNLGVSNELYGQLLLFSGLRTGQIESYAAVRFEDDAVVLSREGLDDHKIGQYLANGNVLFADNQVVLDLLEPGVGFSISSIMIMTLDDLAFHGNQCDCSLLDDFVLMQAFLLGFSLRVSDNRFKEGLYNALLSAASFGFLNMTKDNQATHCLMIRPSPPYPLTVDGPNTVLPIGPFARYCKAFDKTMGDFGQQGQMAKAPEDPQ